MADFKSYTQNLAPRGGWLRDTASQAWLGGMGQAIGTTLDLDKEGVKVRFASTCPVDALPVVGDSRQIEQAPEEADADYRLRLGQAFDYHFERPTPEGYKNALVPLGIDPANIVVYSDWEDSVLPSAVPADSWWSRVMIVVDATGGPWIQPVWDAGDVWTADAVWGIDGVTQAEIAYLKRTIRRNKWAGAFPMALIIIFDNVAWPLNTDWSLGGWVGDPDVAIAPLGRVWGWNENVYGSAPDLWMADEVWRDPFDI